MPVTRRIVKNTAPRIDAVIRAMSPICFTQACTNAPSGSVLVSDDEFSNSASTSFAISAAREGSLTRIVYQPTSPLPNPDRRASSK